MEPRKTSSWRSSTWLVIFTATLGLFTENFLYGFVVPIMTYMFEVRLKQKPEYTQRYASAMLFILGFISVFCAPVIGHLADKIPGRKTPLMFSLILSLIGTALVAATPSVWAVFLGRIFEGASGTIGWIVCFAMLTDNIDKRHFGKTLGFASSFVTAGVLGGPVVAGTLLEWLGYWPAWTVPFTLLAIDLTARLVMIEDGKARKGVPKTDITTQETPGMPSASEETTGLLAGNREIPEPSTAEAKSPPRHGFHRIMLTNTKILTGLSVIVVFSLIIAAFDATLPLHLQRTFGWGPAPVGLVFLAIQVPGLVLAPVVGWLRDRVGLRWPTTIGWALQTPLMWFVGVPGSWNLPGLDTKSKQEAAFVAGIIGMALVAPLTRGAGSFQMTLTLREIQENEPGIFGPNGGSSRLFAMQEVAFNIGLMLGPVVGGALADTLGFSWMMSFLALCCAIASAICALFMTQKNSGADDRAAAEVS